MINVGPSSTPEVVFTASSPGIYEFLLVRVSSTPGDLFQGSAALDMSNNSGASRGAVCYLNTNDQLSYQGPAAQLAGVRLGDELSE